MSYSEVGKVWDPEGFASYIQGIDLSWASGITMHHTWKPSLEQRPRGFTIQHIRNIESFYRRKGWSRGPHLFVDDDQGFGMSPFHERGIHAVSFNRTHIGIEVLGDYDREDPNSGRGKNCWDTASEFVEILLAEMGLGAHVVNGHRDDPRTYKTCPGRLVDLDKFRTGLEPREDPDDDPKK